MIQEMSAPKKTTASKKPNSSPKPTASKKPNSSTKTPTKKVTKKSSDPSLKINEEEKKKFPYEMFPVKVMHMDGKEKKDLKTCYFTSEVYAKKYIDRSNFKKNEYLFFVRGK